MLNTGKQCCSLFVGGGLHAKPLSRHHRCGESFRCGSGGLPGHRDGTVAPTKAAPRQGTPFWERAFAMPSGCDREIAFLGEYGLTGGESWSAKGLWLATTQWEGRNL